MYSLSLSLLSPLSLSPLSFSLFSLTVHSIPPSLSLSLPPFELRLPAKRRRISLVASAISCFAPGLVASALASSPLPSSTSPPAAKRCSPSLVASVISCFMPRRDFSLRPHNFAAANKSIGLALIERGKLETEACVKHSPPPLHVDAYRELNGLRELELGEDRKELVAELKKMVPVNGKTVLIFRAPCGCPLGRMEIFPDSKRSEEGRLVQSTEAAAEEKLDIGPLNGCTNDNKTFSSNVEIQQSLRKEILTLEKRLQDQVSVRGALERALGYRASSHDITSEATIPKPATELIGEISVLELEVGRLEQYLLSLYRKAFDPQVSTVSPLKKDEGFKSPLTTPRRRRLDFSTSDITPAK